MNNSINTESVRNTGARIWTAIQESRLYVKVFGTLLALSAARILYCKLHRKLMKYPPGPIGLPFIGSFFAATDVPKYAAYLASNYGTVTMMYVASQPFVFLHSSEAMIEVFKTQAINDRDWDNSLAFGYAKPHEFPVALANETYWRSKRKRFQSVILARADSAFLTRVHNRSLKVHVFPSIDRCIADAETQGLWYFSDDVNYLQFHSIWNAGFGTYLEYDSVEKTKCIEYVLQLYADLGVDVLLRYTYIDKFLTHSMKRNLLPAVREFTEFLEQQIYNHLGYDESVFDFCSDHSATATATATAATAATDTDTDTDAGTRTTQKWDLHFAQVRKDPHACAVAKIIAAHRADPDAIDNTKESILQVLLQLFAAGIDTSIHTSEFGLVLLAKNPDVQELIHQEVRDVFGDDIWFENTPFASVVNELHYLRAFVHEVVRLSCVVAAGVAHCNSQSDILVHGRYPKEKGGGSYLCRIPKGSSIMPDVPTANIRDEYWQTKCSAEDNDGGNGNKTQKGRGRNASHVCIDAWLDERKRFRMHYNKDRMVSFGVGKRDCAGSALALRSAYVLFTKLLLKYKFDLPDHIPKDVQIKQEFEFTFVMEPKIPLKVTQRVH